MQAFEGILEELAQLYNRMDQAYAQAALAHGFVCAGCEDSCCQTRFYHHTLVEYLHLKKGVSLLAPAEQQRLFQRAARTVEEMGAADGRGPSAMCPLNEAGRCILYAYRPMICRLHGIPHQLRRPDGLRQLGPGCGDFDRQCGRSTDVFLDRTPLYAGLADLERRLRRQRAFEGKIKLSIAQMLIHKIEGNDAAPPAGETHEIP
ncbi:MAG: hypothetical protein C4519_01975 [Desulfobacteraceae bacterium]|nr:MAG: hypothetical protein C4519_01975 [Desulfobacteraceae bacterium]